MVIAKTMKGAGWFASAIFRSAIYKYAKDRGVWYYRILLSQQFSDVITNVYDMNRLERKLNPDPFSSVQKKVFSVDDRGNIYDDRTGEVFGNTNDKVNNKFDMDNEEDARMEEEEEVKPKRGRPKKS
jgi:hypothetical protein|tara:strand:- start:216 stop:596 length:381 start_codon:yes stop_codon:yes gene_type:complete